MIRARTRDVSARRRARDAAGEHRIRIAEYSAETCQIVREGGKLVVYAVRDQVNEGETTADEITNGVVVGGPGSAVEEQLRQATGDGGGAIGAMNRRHREFWARIGGRQ